MIYQSTNTWMTSRETCFLCSVQHGARFWKCLWVYFGLKQVKSPKKVQQELITIERKMEKRGQKELLTTLECLTNYKKSSQQLPSCFIAMRDSPFCKTFSPLFCFEQGKTFFFSFLHHRIKQIESMLPWVCSEIDHRRRQNVVKISVMTVELPKHVLLQRTLNCCL